MRAMQGFVEAITHGVSVRAAAAVVPEHLTQATSTHFFTYRCTRCKILLLHVWLASAMPAAISPN